VKKHEPTTDELTAAVSEAVSVAETTNVAAPSVLKIQSHKVTVAGDLYERDGVKYLLVERVEDDYGVVEMTHEEYGIQPFGE